MSNNIEWSHAAAGSALIGPDVIADVSPDGNDERDWGVEFGSDGASILYGSLEQLEIVLGAALEQVREARRRDADLTTDQQ